MLRPPPDTRPFGDLDTTPALPPSDLAATSCSILLRVGADRVRRTRHRMRRLAAARRAGPGQVLAGVAPYHFALLPRHAEDFGGDPVHVA